MKPIYEESAFHSAGADLAAYLWRPESLTTPQPYVLMAHGLTNSHEDAPLFGLLRDRLLRAGCAVFMFDFYGSGNSEGTFPEKTWRNQRQNLADAITYLADELATPDDPIALFGRSVGGTLCSFFLQHPRITCAVVASPPVLLEEGFGRYRSRAVDGFVHMPPDLDRSGQIRGDWRLREEFFDDLVRTEKELRIAASGARRVLVTHGAADPKVERQNSSDLFGLLAEPKRCLLIEDADHYYNGAEANVVEAAAEWIEHYIMAGS